MESELYSYRTEVLQELIEIKTLNHFLSAVLSSSRLFFTCGSFATQRRRRSGSEKGVDCISFPEIESILFAVDFVRFSCLFFLEDT